MNEQELKERTARMKNEIFPSRSIVESTANRLSGEEKLMRPQQEKIPSREVIENTVDQLSHKEKRKRPACSKYIAAAACVALVLAAGVAARGNFLPGIRKDRQAPGGMPEFAQAEDGQGQADAMNSTVAALYTEPDLLESCAPEATVSIPATEPPMTSGAFAVGVTEGYTSSADTVPESGTAVRVSGDAAEPMTEIAPEVITEPCYVPEWNSMMIYQQFPFFNYNGCEYDCMTLRLPDAGVKPELIGQKVADIEMTGTDFYKNTAQTVTASLYEIRGVSPSLIMAVQFPGEKGYYPYTNVNHCADSLSAWVSDLGNTVTLQAQSIDIHRITDGMANMDKTYRPKSDTDQKKLFALVLNSTDGAAKSREKYGVTWVEIYAFSPELGCEITLSLSEQGYLKISSLLNEPAFSIGKDGVKAVKSLIETEFALTTQWD